MITLMIAVAVACGCGASLHWGADWGVGWSVFMGVVAFMAVNGVAGFLVRKRVMRDMDRVQGILKAGQERLQAKMRRWQVRPPGSMQAVQREMFDDTKCFVREALKETETLRKYRPWMLFIERQMATAQLQLNWMVKDFKTVDRLMPKAMLLDPTMVAMKMARMYVLEAPTADIEKVYRKCVRRLKYNQNVLVAATWSWILVKRGEHDAAFAALTEALKKSDDETLRRNHECLMNNRPAQFTNSLIGDTWYSLWLEEPKTRAPRQHVAWR